MKNILLCIHFLLLNYEQNEMTAILITKLYTISECITLLVLYFLVECVTLIIRLDMKSNYSVTLLFHHESAAHYLL